MDFGGCKSRIHGVTQMEPGATMSEEAVSQESQLHLHLAWWSWEKGSHPGWFQFSYLFITQLSTGCVGNNTLKLHGLWESPVAFSDGELSSTLCFHSLPLAVSPFVLERPLEAATGGKTSKRPVRKLSWWIRTTFSSSSSFLHVPPCLETSHDGGM